MKYVIDASRKFDGSVITSMQDDVHSDYGGETLEELQERYPGARLADKEEVQKLFDQYIADMVSEPFEEIDEERYYELMNCVPPARSSHNWFFVGEPYQYKVHHLCFTVADRYFWARRRVDAPAEQINEEIHKFAQTLIFVMERKKKNLQHK